MSTRVLWITCWLGILIPLSVDNILSIPIHHYDLRVPYLFTALSLVVFAWEWLRKEKWARKLLKEFFESRHLLFFLLMGLSGFVAVFFSHAQTRSVLFWIWGFGTALTVPFLVRVFENRIGPLFLTGLASYAALQAGIVIWDQMMWVIGTTDFTIGRVYPASMSRPHAFYQEPSYYAGFSVLTLCWLGLLLSRRSPPRTFQICAVLIVFGILFSTSRMGLLAVLVMMPLWLVWQMGLSAKFYRKLAIGSLALCLPFAIAPPLQKAAGQLLGFSGSVSLSERRQAASASLWVFSNRPVFGVGPGGAGAFLVDEHSDHPYVKWQLSHGNKRELLRRDPLAKDLYTELLAEWGAFGFIAFVLGLFFLLFRPLGHLARLWYAFPLGLVYATSQTFARFDLWICVGVMAMVANRHNRR